MGCGTECIKCLIIFFNITLALSGIALISFGTLIVIDVSVVQCYILIAMGAINLLAALLGCCGICAQNVCLTATYVVLMICSLVGQIYNRIKPMTMEEIKKTFRSVMDAVWEKEIKKSGAMDLKQEIYECCGVNGPSDYQTIQRFILPASCYPGNTNKADNSYFKIGCVEAMYKKVEPLSTYREITEWTAVGITAVLLIFGIYLACRFSKNDRYRY